MKLVCCCIIESTE